MENFEPRIMPYVRQKIANDAEITRIRKQKADKEILFEVYRQIDKLFGKPLSAFQAATVLSHTRRGFGWKSHELTTFTVDAFTFKYVRFLYYDFSGALYVKSKKWYRNWYNTEYSAEKFLQLMEKGKI